MATFVLANVLLLSPHSACEESQQLEVTNQIATFDCAIAQALVVICSGVLKKKILLGDFGGLAAFENIKK